MDRQITLAEPPPDAAAQAFNEPRQEIAFMRRAMEKFTDEHPRIEIPDYTETLSDISDRTGSLATSLKKLRETPVLQTTPDQIGKQIVAAGTQARSAEQAAFSKATADNVALSRDLSGYLDRAKTADTQFKWLCGIFILGFVIGGLIIGATLRLVWRNGETVQMTATEQVQPTKGNRR